MSSKPTTTFILGIDPGFSGALALYDPYQNQVIDVWDMPTESFSRLLDKTQHERLEISGAKLDQIVKPLASRLSMASIERVHASPGAGVTSMFRFGEGYGLLLGILLANGVRTITPSPSVWKVSMGLTHNKQDSLDAVESMFGGGIRERFCPLKRHHGRAEAILLAVYAAKKTLTFKTPTN